MGVVRASYYPPSYDDRATTPGQGLSYGLARIIQAEARYNSETAEAAINFSEAQRREIENWQKWTETYFEVRRINREMRAAERGKPPTEADFIRYAQIGKPRRLTPSELDAITGDISWPLLLRAARAGEVSRRPGPGFRAAGSQRSHRRRCVFAGLSIDLGNARRVAAADPRRAGVRLCGRPAVPGQLRLRGPLAGNLMRRRVMLQSTSASCTKRASFRAVLESG